MRMILVHGSLCQAAVWQRVIPELESLGHEPVAIDLPGHGSNRDVRATVESYRGAVLDISRPGDVLVGHSSGGWAVTLAADAQPDRFRHLVYLAAAVPEEGAPLGARRISVPEMQPSARQSADGEWSEMVEYDGARHHLFSDLDEEDARWAFAHLCPEPLTQLREPVSLARFWSASVPRSYILCTQDRAYPIDYMGNAATRLGVEPILLDSGHFPIINRARETSELIARCVADDAA
jgi:pimeloyl-ACP methyl ester carboxylesterase